MGQLTQMCPPGTTVECRGGTHPLHRVLKTGQGLWQYLNPIFPGQNALTTG